MNPQCIDDGTLRAYRDGALSAHEAESVEAHLQDCAMCRSTLGEQQSAASQVKGLLGPYLQINPTTTEAAFERIKAQLSATNAAQPATTQKTVPPVPTNAAPRLPASRQRRNLPIMAGLGFGLAASLMVAFWLAGFFGTADGGLAGLSKGDFVPQGKVRHLVYIHYNEYASVDGEASAPTQDQEDVWLANGKEHLLMYRTLSNHPDDWLLVNDDGAYTYRPNGTWAIKAPLGFGPGYGPAIFRTPYDHRYISWYLPGSNDLPDLLQRPNTQSVEGGLINGRDTVMLEMLDNMNANARVLPTGGASTVVEINQPFQYFGATASLWGSAIGYNIEGTPQPKPTETPTLKLTYSPRSMWSSRMDYRMWFDKETNQLLQQQYVTRRTGDGEAGNVYTHTIKLSQVGIMEQSTAPSDLFTVKPREGATSVDAEVVFSPALLPANEYVEPESSNIGATGWYLDTWEQGGFSYLRRREAGGVQNNGEWHRQGSTDGKIEYIVGYRDHTEVISRDKLDAWLDQQIPEFVATMNGTVRTSYPTVSLDDTFIGRDLLIDRKDGRATRAMVYAMGQRMYFIYATGPDVKSVTDDHVSEYLNSFTITTPSDKLPVVGNLAPDFALQDVRTGQLVSLSGFRGKPVVLTFLSTRCVPCKTAYADLAKVVSHQ